MLNQYEKFLKEFDKKLKKYFASQSQYIKCQKGCTNCCEIGEYPFSRLEAEYIMFGLPKLPNHVQQKIRQNIKNLIETKKKNLTERFVYKCPFLIDNLCSLYERRSITCRTFGLAYLCGGKIKLPECANLGLNYSEIYDSQKHEISLPDPITDSLRIDSILKSPLAEKYELECGEIRPLVEWFDSKK